MANRTNLDAVLKALRFRDRSLLELEGIPERDWPAVLQAMDRAHLTLALGARCSGSLPDSVRTRIERNLADNRIRCERVVTAQTQITEALGLYGIDHVVLKGLAQWPWYTDDPVDRPQYDIDIYVPAKFMPDAAKAVQALGYTPAGDVLDPGADHLPVMIRRTGWTWRGDYHDAEMPLSLELHFRFWNAAMMRFCTEDLSQFWQRHAVREINGIRFNTLHPVDGLSYSAMHLVRHLLSGDLRLRHVYEIAHFLERSAREDCFWAEWRETALAACRAMEGIAFRLARDWFRPNLHPAAEDAIDRLPASVNRWFSLFGSSPAWAPSGADGGPGKNEIWLHFCLLSSAKEKRDVAMRRLFPKRRMRVHLDPHLAASKVGAALRVRRKFFEVSFIGKRVLHHALALAPTLHGAFLWRFARTTDCKRTVENFQPGSAASIPPGQPRRTVP